jgi:tRNA (cytidine/uridine-2'-O-)-methyltransferase
VPPEQVLRIPMQPQSRSLNISNAAAIVLYEAWRQLGFVGGR